MKKRQRMYRHVLRGTAGVAAALVMVSSLFTVPVQEKKYESTALLANAVGMFVGVAANPDNTKAAALLAKEQELQARESALAASAPVSQSSGYDLLSLVALAVSSLVLLLVVLNFYFDHLHTVESRRGPLVKS